MLGTGRVRTTVTAELDFTQREETQELYDPETVVRSEQVAEERARGAGLLGGIPGALSNQPPPPAQAAGATPNPAIPADAANAQAAAAAPAAPDNESIRRTRNFEMDRTLSHTKQPFGGIQRLSVAVLIAEKTITDDEGNVVPEKLADAELEAMTKLVRDAVGYDEKRGDTVSVSSMAFWQPPENTAPAEEPGFLQNPAVQSYGKQGLAAALVLIVVMVLVKPLLRALAGGAPAAAGNQAALAGPGGNFAADPRIPLSYDEKVSVARQLADKNPERVAQIVRAWVQSDG